MVSIHHDTVVKLYMCGQYLTFLFCRRNVIDSLPYVSTKEESSKRSIPNTGFTKEL